MSWLNGGKPLSPGCAPEVSADMPEGFGVSEGDYHIVKPGYSAFFRAGLDEQFRELGAGTVILAGTTTPNCVRMTCCDAISTGMRTDIPAFYAVLLIFRCGSNTIALKTVCFGKDRIQ